MKRRQILKGAGSAGLIGLAGCSGNSSDSDSGGDESGSGGSESSGGDTVAGTASSSKPFSGVTLDYWNIINVQSRSARTLSEEFVKEFEQDTGATVNVNWTGYSALTGSKWINEFENGNNPVLYDSAMYQSGKIVGGGHVKPLAEYKDRLNEEVLSNIEWTYDQLEQVWRPYEGSGPEHFFEIPYGLQPREPQAARVDHFEEAGLDIEDDFYNISGYDQLVDVATTLKQDGPADVGYSIFGAEFDCTDVQQIIWAVAEGGKDGLYLNEDATDTNFDNEVWKDTFRKYVELKTKHGLAPQNAAQLADEKSVPQLVAGNWSISSMDFQNHGEFMAQGEKLMKDGTIQYGTMWPGKADQKGFNYSFPSLGITRKPNGVDQAKWDRKEEAAIEFINRWYTKDFQMRQFRQFGNLPIRQDLWEELPRAEHRRVEVALELAKNSKYSVACHPQMGSIFSSIPAPHAQDAINGKISPEEACDRIASDVREVL